MINSIEYDTDSFNDFFYPDKLKYKYTYYFRNGKITQINADPFDKEDKAKAAFQEKFTAFYKWVIATEPYNAKYLTTTDRHSAEVTKTLLGKYILVIKQ